MFTLFLEEFCQFSQLKTFQKLDFSAYPPFKHFQENPNLLLKCYLLDDSGYVVYSSDRNITYSRPWNVTDESVLNGPKYRSVI